MTVKQPISLRTVNPDEFLPPISRWSKLGGVALLGVFGGVLTFAALFKYNVTVKAPAVIRPAGDLRVVQAATAGTVTEIIAQANQTVQQGDAIAVLDDTAQQTQKRQLDITIDQLQTQIQQASQQLTALENQITAEQSRLAGAIAGAEAELKLAQRQYQDQDAIAQANVREAEAAVKFAEEELNRFRQLANTGAVADLQIEEKAAALETAQARLERARAALNPTAAEVEQSQQSVAQAIANRDATLAQLAQTRQQIQQQQADLQDQLLNRQQDLRQLETDLSQVIIRSPIDGIVQTMDLRNSQQVVQVGDIIGYISPTQTELEIKAAVSQAHISQVEIGQTVQMRIDSCSYPDYGVAAGVVSAIAPDAHVQNSDRPDGTSSSTAAVYDVTIQPQQLTLHTTYQTCTLQAGMQGRADIITRQETMLRLIFRKLRLFVDQ
ncbi:MAG: HlyD family secretion protein [Thainema sp.]